MVGFSDITNLHLALWRHCRLAGVHGCIAPGRAAEAVRQLIMEARPATLHQDQRALTAAIGFPGRAAGPLIGGNLGTIAGFAGAGMPSLDGAILPLATPIGPIAHLDTSAGTLTVSPAVG